MGPFPFFISYRRADTAPVALLLKNEIEKRLQFVRVFVDVQNLKLGEPFPDRLKQAIDVARATLVLVGSRWMPSRGEPTARPGPDFVAMEIERSLTAPVLLPSGRKSKIRREVIPVFINIDQGFERFELPHAIQAISSLHGYRLDYASWPALIGPFIESIALQLGLQKRPDSDEFPKANPAKARTQPVSDDELLTLLGYDDYEGWYLDNFGNSDIRYIVKTFKFPHFNQAHDFMKLVSDHCRILDHHPEWRNVFNHVTVSLTTWDARRQVTIYDLNLALFMNKAAEAVLGSKD